MIPIIHTGKQSRRRFFQTTLVPKDLLNLQQSTRSPPLSPTCAADREPGHPDVQRRVLSARRASSGGLVVGQITTPLSPPGHTHGAHAGTSTPLGGNLADRHRNTPTPRPPWGFTHVHIISFRCGVLELGTTLAGSAWPQPVFFPLFWVECPSSTRLEALVLSHDSRAMTRPPSPRAQRPDFPGTAREAPCVPLFLPFLWPLGHIF